MSKVKKRTQARATGPHDSTPAPAPAIVTTRISGAAQNIIKALADVFASADADRPGRADDPEHGTIEWGDPAGRRTEEAIERLRTAAARFDEAEAPEARRQLVITDGLPLPELAGKRVVSYHHQAPC